MGEERGAAVAEDQAWLWEVGEEQSPLLLVFLGVWAHPWVLKHIP